MRRFLLLFLVLAAPALYYAQAGAPPVARSVVVTTQEGTAKSGTLLAVDPDGGPRTFSIATSPATGTLTIDDATTGAFTYTPDAGAMGYDTFTFQVSDGSSSSTATGSVFISAASPQWPGQTVRASIAPGGGQLNPSMTLGAMSSADGRFIAFSSGTADESTGNFDVHVYVHDRQTGQTTIGSKANGSEQSIGGIFPSISSDGRFVAFVTLGAGVPGGNPNADFDAFVHDRQNGETARISVASDGTPGNGDSGFPALSADGRYAAFNSESTNLVAADTDTNEDVYLRDRVTGQTTLVSVSTAGAKGNADSWLPTMSADARYIAFWSQSSNLVAGDTNGRIDLFVRDLWTGQTTRASVGSGGAQLNADSAGMLSADGRFVVFESEASNAVASDTNGASDVFVHDRQSGQTTRVSISSAGAQGDGASTAASISADGRYVTFRSAAVNLVPGDTNGVTDNFVHDRLTGRTVRVNVASDGTEANAASMVESDGCCAQSLISPDGRSVVFTSLASNLVADDTNGRDDFFVVGPVSVNPTTVNVGAVGGARSINVSFDYPGTPWTATTTTPWITLTPPIGGSANGAVSFTVAPNTGTARAGTIVAALQTITVNQGAPTVPVAQNSAITTPEDTAIGSTLIASDTDGDALTFSLVTPPLFGAVVITNAATGSFSYAPAPNFTGLDSFTFHASDGTTFSNTATVTVNVTGVNDGPVAINRTLSAFENTLTNGTLAATDAEEDVLSFSIVTPPTHGAASIVNTATGLYAYTPAPGFSGSDSFTFVASDAGGSSHVAIVTISVSPAAAITASFRTIGDLPGGPILGLVRDATRVGGVIHAVGGSAANTQILCSAPNVPVGCVGQFNPDTAVLWTSNAGAGVLIPLPNLVTPATPATNGAPATAITRDGNYIASQARNSVTASGQTAAVRVTRSGLVNLDLSAPPFLALNPPSVALSMSDDGSIVYATAGNPVRAFRFDINASSRVFIPLLLGSHTGNVVAGRAASIDGSVAVGTSFTAPLTATNGRAFRYVHGSPGGTVSAIPLLAGGTWNRAIAVSADGRLTVVIGNSSSQANGEVYVHDAVTGANTPFGSPMTLWAPANLAGITADGSVVAANFADPTRPDGTSHAYVHNANGWFHLTTILVAAGIDLAAQGFGESNMRVTGVSPDGTLVFGSLERDDIPGIDATEGFVAELPPGYLKSFDVPAVPQTDTSIVGVWTDTGGSGDDVVVFLADGTFFLIDTRWGTQPVGERTSGFERGRYHWDASTGAFSFATLLDTNGSVGLSGGNGGGILPLTVSGDTLVLANEITLKRVTGAANSLVGGWVMGDPRLPDSSAVLVLFADGRFVFAEDGNGALDPLGRDGVEAGTYVWGANGSFTVNVTLDATGEWGFGNGPGTGGTTTVQLSPDGLRLGQPGDPDQFKRIVDAAAVVPVITSPLVATGTVGTPFAYTITATWASSFGAAGLPNGLSINNTTGVISGTPTATGTFPVTISATTSLNSTTTATLTLTVIAPPTLAVANASGSFGGTTTLTATLMSAGTPLAGQQVSFSLNGSPAGSATTNGSGVATLTGVSLAGVGAGTYPTGAQATFAGIPTHAPASGAAVLTVAKAIPVITWPAPANITHGTPLGAPQLNATANVPGTFVYTPPSGTVLPVGAGQTLSVMFTPTDGANFATVQAQVTITVLNAAPVARGVVVTTQEGVVKSATLQAFDAENDPLTFSIVTMPTRGTLTLVNPSTGAFTYTPNAGAIGYDSFMYRAAEGGGASSTATGAVFIVAVSPQRPGQIVRASVASDGGTGSGGQAPSSLSADGRFIAFWSPSSNLVAGDTNGKSDIFVRDRQTGQTVRVSLASDGTQANDNSNGPVLSPDGRFVAFYSLASNLVAGDTNGTLDAFVYDRQTGQTVRVSVASNGTQGNGDSTFPVLSADGRYVAFASFASNLVAGDTNGTWDTFVHDRQTGQTTRVSVTSSGAQSTGGGTLPVMSADGRFVAFESGAPDLVAGDTNGFPDVFVHDRQTGQTSRVSVASNGAQSNSASNGPSISADGRFVAFRSVSVDLVAGDTNNTGDIFVHDRQTGQTVRVSVSSTGTQGNGFSRTPGLSADGRFVSFDSEASNLVAGDTNLTADTFVHDRQTGQTVRISLASNGAQPDSSSTSPAMSADGRFVTFTSEAGRLVPEDLTFGPDVFVVGGGGVSVSPTTVNVPAAGGTQSVNVTLDFPGTPWTATTTTPWITLNPPVGGSTSGAVSFTAAANPGAARTGTIVVAQQTVTVNQAPSTTPVAVNGAITTAEDTSVSGALSASDPNGDAITFGVLTQPAHGSVALTNPSTGAFTYTPAAHFNGADSFTFQVTAGGESSNVATESIAVTPVNDAPIAANGTLATSEDTIAIGTLVATDVDNAALTFSVVSQPAHGVVAITNAATGAYVYTPAANYNGADGFTFRASDGSLNSNAATVTIAIAAVADPPVANNIVLSMQEGAARSGTLLAFDAESDPLTFSIVTQPAKGTLILVNPSTGAFTYTPTEGAMGYDSFTFRATESGGASSTATGSVFIVAASPRWPGQTVRASVASDGSEQNGASNLGAMPSADGRFIVFASGATNLAAGIPAGSVNVFVHDRQTGQTSLVSKASGSEQPIGGALPRMTPDGRYVGFATFGSSLPGGNPDAEFDAIVHDRLTGQTTRVSVASDGTPGNGFSILPMLSADGRYVTFYGSATNLVAGNTDGGEDVYLHDRQTGQTTLVSVSSAGVKGNNGSWAPSISVDGRFIAFQSEASNLVPNDTNGAIDVFVRDLWTGQTTRASVASGGGEGNSSSQGAISPDGRYVVFASAASNLVAGDTNSRGDVFVRDLQTGQTTRVSLSSAGAQGNGSSEDATISADGRYVAFRSIASNLVPGDTNGEWDEFVHDRLTGQTVRINVASNGTQANAASIGDDDGCCITPAISADGRSIVIMSLASNLVDGDSNGTDDVFVVGPVLVAPTTVSVSNAAGTHSVNVSVDYPGPWTATTTTPWITLNPPVGGSGSGTVSFAVTANQGATRTGTIVVALQTVTVNQGASTVPVAQDGSFTTPEDTVFSGTLVATDPNGDPLTFNVVTQPLRGTVVLSNPATGAFTYTPAANQFGADSFTFQASAGGELSNVASMSVAVTPVNDAPVASNGTLAAIEDTATPGTLVATDVDGNPLTFSIVAPPVHGVVVITNAATGAYSYTPAAEYLGPDSFTFRAADGSLISNVATVTITSITPVNDAPVATSVVVTTQEAVSQTGMLLGTDIDSPVVTFSIVTAPTKGTLTLNNPVTGAFTYAPNVGALGYDIFTFQVADGAGGSSTATGMVFIVAASPRWPGQTIRASVSSGGAQGNGQSLGSVLSADGRFIAFESDASSLVAGDTNGLRDVFVHDRQTSQTTRVSVASNGSQGNGLSVAPNLSPDGRFVTFTSQASNLVSGDTNGQPDVFLYDRQTGQTTRVSVASDGAQANQASSFATPSADGRYISFLSSASNLVAGDTNGQNDVFVHDRQTGQTTRVNVASNGAQANNLSQHPTLSADGRYVAFSSPASNLAAGDTDQADDVFVHDRQTRETTLVSTNNVLQESSSFPVLSPDGRFVVFSAYTTSGVILGFNPFVYDRQSGVSQQIRGGSTTNIRPSVSADGRYIAFTSTLPTSLVPNDTNGSVDSFVYDRETGLTRRVSVSSAGEQGINGGSSSFLSADARFVAFDSVSSNLVPSDTNGLFDAFVVGGVSVSPTTVSVPGSGGSRSVDVSVDYPGTSWTATTTTPWITINPPGGGSASGTVSFTVAANPGAARTGTIVVALQTVTVNQGPSTAPVAQNLSFTTLEDTPLSGTLVATDPEGDAIAFSVITQPLRGSVVVTNPATGAFTYTPSPNRFGGDSFTFQATAGGETSNIATVIIDVTPVNDAPGAFDSTLQATEDMPASSFFSTADSDSLFTTVELVTPPAHGTVTIPNPVGGALGGVSYTYTPSPNYNGPDSFTFRAVEAGLNSNVATVTISVAPANDAPVASSMVVTAQDGAVQTGLLQATDIDGDALTFSIVTPPTKGILTITNPATGAFGYTPNASAFGYDTFAFRAADGSGASSSATAMVFIVASSPRWPGGLVRASVASNGAQANAESFSVAVSADGRYTAFESNASNLVAGDTNDMADVFVRDRNTGVVTRVSVGSGGVQANSTSGSPALSADGRYIAFISGASNLVAGDSNGVDDVFVRDLQSGQTTRVGPIVDPTATSWIVVKPALSADGRYVAFVSVASNVVAGDTNGLYDVFVHDRQTGQTTRVNVASGGTPANQSSFAVGLSADGRYVAFTTTASNLVAGDTNGQDDVFVHDRVTGQTTRASVSTAGTQANGFNREPEISADGRYVAFYSSASNLVPGDTNGVSDVFIRDLQTGQTTRMSEASDGAQANQSSFVLALSADARYVLFESSASNLVPGDTNARTDLFVRDRGAGVTTRVSLTNDGGEPGLGANFTVMSADGRFIGFVSFSANLVPSDTNGATDVFLFGGVSVTPTAVNLPSSGGSRSVNVAFVYPGTWTASTTTPWITINPPAGGSANGAVSFTVAPNTGAARTGTLVVASQTVTVTQDAATAPVAQSSSATETREDTSVTGTLVATDPNGDPITFSLVALPSHGTVVLNDSATGSFTYTPAPNFHGTDSFTFRATAGGELSNVAVMAIPVTPVNDVPLATGGSLAVVEDSSATGTLTAVDVDGDVLTFTILTPPSHGIVTITNTMTGAYTYWPAANYNGADSFTFRAFDGGTLSNIATVTVSVAAVEDVPLASSVVLATPEGVALSGTLLGTDADGDAVTLTVLTSPTKGSLTGTDLATGAFTYTPNPGAAGYDSFTFRASNAAGSSTGTASIIIVANSPRWPGQTVRVGTLPVGNSQFTTISADGRYIAFGSSSSTLVAGDTNGQPDVFVYDRQSAVTTRVSVATDGTQGNGFSVDPAVSGDGRYVAFRSAASSLVAGDTNGTTDIFVHDRQTGVTTRVSVASDGTQANSISQEVAISTDGRYVTFKSNASNLVPADTNDVSDVFVHDRYTGVTTRESVASNGQQGFRSNEKPVLSGDGRYVAFYSAEGFVAADTNAVSDVFVRDRQTGVTTRVSVATGGGQGDSNSSVPSLSVDGRYVAFGSDASNLVAGDTNGVSDVFVHDRETGMTTRVSVSDDGTQGNGISGGPVLSADGRFVAFMSFASNLVVGDTNGQPDVFVHDRETGVTRRLSVASTGTQGNGLSYQAALSADGRHVAFSSVASNLVAGDTNGVEDIFVAGGVKVSPTAISVPADGGTSSFDVSFDYPGTVWGVATTTPWITVQPPASGSINRSVTFSVAPNFGPARTGTIVAALQTITVTQDAFADVTPPIVIPPAAIAVYATVPGGATPGTLPALAAFLAGATAVDNAPVPPVQQAPQLNGAAITGTTVFAPGVNTITFSFSDAAGNVGTATSVVVVIGGGQPSLSVALVGTIAAAGQQSATLRVTNNGTANALNLNIALSSTRTLVGTGTVSLVSGLPATIPPLGPGQSSDIPIVLDVPTTVRRFALSETLTMTNYLGASLSTTPAQTVFPADVTGPTITVGPTVPGTMTSTSITITWQTNEGATSRVFWGVGTSTNRSTTEDSVYKTSHSVTLTGLVPNTLYSYIVYGHDQAGNFYQSSRREVRTLP